ncbi:exonuclease sbcCD subunit D [Sutcliffiella horikoshii]|uniref:Nuclease SbcCD subunit D n=1 Tax=Sutcliffiella horikoshii TaxID=79883 RepID=A0A1Y0CT60_9BACI|nr:exonuclease subunit SbcD [Sutcliffiella horikoshii]ART78561.1 exonuclease sbcCD subunit D [Sutcliffiella horikoshii]TYS61016.1 exonuclease subunit SbcD [Sutcliffiella horikoshii]
MRILHTADWHLGKTLEGRSRLPEQAQFLEELLHIVEEEKVDVVLMAGDVYDTVNPPAQAEVLFYESLQQLSNNGKRPVAVIAGNHDNPDRLSASRPLASSQNISLLGYPTMDVQSIYVPTTEETLKLASLPYPSESRLNEVLSEEFEEKVIRDHYDARIRQFFDKMCEQFTEASVNIAMSHLFVAGGNSTDSERPIEVGGAFTVAAESLPHQAQYVALGHLHRPQTIKRAKTAARYSGSPLAYSFSEAGYTKSVTIIDAKPGKEVETKEIFLSSGKPLVRWKATEGVQQVYGWLEEKKDNNAWVDLEIHVTNALSMEEIHRIRKHHDGILHIRPIFPEMVEERKAVKMDSVPIEELFVRFYEKQSGGAKPEDELVRLFLSLLQDETVKEEQV